MWCRGILGGLVWCWPVLASAEEPLCAVVQIEIRQELSFVRQGFEATMRITNGMDVGAISNVQILVAGRDASEVPIEMSSDTQNSSAEFFVRLLGADKAGNLNQQNPLSLSGGEIAAKDTAALTWLIIPTERAVAQQAASYLIGARVRYTYQGREEEIEVAPDMITVKPLPDLRLEYFMPRDVWGDDPLTAAVIEPVQPYTLGARLLNAGWGTAKDLRIDSAQPRIVMNPQGLLIDFKIHGSYVGEAEAEKTLLLNFGELQPQSVKVGRWWMTSSLDGRYTDFSASFNHADELGGETTALLKPIKTYFLIKDVVSTSSGSDGVRDYLAWLDRDSDSTGPVALFHSQLTGNDYTSGVLGCQSCELVQPLEGNWVPGAEGGTLAVAPVAGPGWITADLAEGEGKVIYQVLRNGQPLPPENAWISRKRSPGNYRGTEGYQLNVFDSSPVAQYTVRLQVSAGNRAPVLQAIPRKVINEGDELGVLVTASDPDGTVPVLSAQGLPSGATFSPEGGNGYLRWATLPGHYGQYRVKVMASDGLASAMQDVLIIVLHPGESEGDVPAAFEDADGDGFTLAEGDPDDADMSRYPGAIDSCGDGVDQDGVGGDPACEQSVADGDINGDGAVSVADLLLAQKHLLGLLELSGAEVARGDLKPATGDQQITVEDVLAITWKVLGAN